MMDVTKSTPPGPGMSRRGLMARAGLVGASAALGTGLLDVGGDRRGNSADGEIAVTFTPKGEKRFAVTDLDILTFALNTEYLEAEFYLRAVNGTGLAASLITGGQGYGKSPYKVVTPGDVTAYASGTTTLTTAATTPVPFTDATIGQFAAEVAQDELEHVTYLRTALGKHAPARPACDLGGAFTAAMQAAGVIGPTDTFDPFASQRNFLLAAYFLNDIGVTAYVGAVPYLGAAAHVQVAAGILGTEAYHAGEMRSLIYSQGQDDDALLVQANAISTLRNNISLQGGGAAVTDQGVDLTSGESNLFPADANGVAFARGFPSLLSLFYLNTTTKTASPTPGGFTPSGFNGRIR